MSLPKRKPTRLKEYDYSQDGCYFVTICTKDRKCILSKISSAQDLETAEVSLTPLGEIAQRQLLDLEQRYPHIKIDAYVIMPNHVHCIVTVISKENIKTISLPSIICAYKSLVSRECKMQYGITELWQRSFNDHIIRDHNDYMVKFNYIMHNAGKWIYDKYYLDER